MTYTQMSFDTKKMEKLRTQIKDALELNNVDIPEEIKISTMTLEAKFNTRFFPWNIYRYIKKSDDGIVNIVKENRNKKDKKKQKAEKVANDMDADYAENAKTNRSREKQRKKSKNKQSEVFLNQVTISIKVSNKEKPVSVKIFNSGTVHFTGCICVDNLLEAAYKLCIECQREIAVIGKDGKIKDIKFAEDANELQLENLYDFKVDMINCIFVVPFNVDRPKLQILMKADGYNASYDSNGHAGVKIKYVSTGKKITIFVFESGSIIIILGNQGFNRINEIHNFIYKYLLENYESIVKDNEITVTTITKHMEKSQMKATEISKMMLDGGRYVKNEKIIVEERDSSTRVISKKQRAKSLDAKSHGLVCTPHI
jgi:TATA-box binding protein (TBP) (component of TFIID and TFIIIB)